MRVQMLSRLAYASLAAIFCLMSNGDARAQQPTPAAISIASEILEVKGQLLVLEKLVDGVIQGSLNTLLQLNPNLFKDLNDVAGSLRKEYAPRFAGLKADLAKDYASRFSESELKETASFFKSPLGKKIIEQEAPFIERTMSSAQDWAIKLNEEVLQRFRAEMKKKGHAF